MLDNGLQKHCQREDFCENVERGTASKRQRKQTWGIHSPQDFVTKLQRPCKDTVCPLCYRLAQCVQRQHLLFYHQHTETKAGATG